MVSLPLALSCVMYFINHRYSGTPLFDVRGVPGVHDFVWWTSLASFFFLYPSTFNILEVAAIDLPEVHLWETGVIRITRHPQVSLALLVLKRNGALPHTNTERLTFLLFFFLIRWWAK